MPDCTNSLSQRREIETRTQQAFRSLSLPAVRPFELSNWEVAFAALCGAPALDFGQAWLPARQETFRRGIVHIGWHGASIILAAGLEDESVFTRATADGQRLWELGDVFEIFLKDSESEEYLELHVTPGGHRSQLRFASDQTIIDLRNGVGRIEDFAVDAPLFNFRVRTEIGRWEVLAQIPASSLRLRVASMEGRVMLASFSRYDYSHEGGPAVLSSTSPHAKLDFHRQHEWTTLVFC